MVVVLLLGVVKAIAESQIGIHVKLLGSNELNDTLEPYFQCCMVYFFIFFRMIAMSRSNVGINVKQRRYKKEEWLL
ncbi:hypothetical protein J2S10_001120 [Neobacillus ginsengisoli]|uniref:Uncharacterized protein n=1 Tax=Neobacillus ginsengisoli TaxID=904295 RepID=A0ABT9XR25_9BACI|nr:hypothetical protein [Neobacillus ginsengisoli]